MIAILGRVSGVVRLLLIGCLVLNAAVRADGVPVVRAVDAVAMTVADMDRSVAFYRSVLNFESVSDIEVAGDEYEHLYGVFALRLRIVKLKLGDEYLQLEQFIAPQGRPIPLDTKSNDHWFQHVAIIVSDMDQAFAALRSHGVVFASSGPQLLPQWNPNAGGISAFYFRDPDGHYLEILHFPADKGAKKWHERTDRLFMGIDHTAIVVGDTEASLKYYRDTLGLRVVGNSENYGIEQERLNSVFGARVRITALRAESGPGVEFLEYRAPHTGRPMPVDTQNNDLWSWHINMSANVKAADAAVREHHYPYISPGATHLQEPNQWSLMVRDPDGHATLLHEP